MEEDDPTLAERTFGKPERTPKFDEHQTISFIRKVAADSQRPKVTRDEANNLLRKWDAAQHLPQQEQIKRLNELKPHIVKFQNENQ